MDIVELRRTAVVKIDVDDEAHQLLQETIARFKQAAQMVADDGWNGAENGYIVTSKTTLHDRTYDSMRSLLLLQSEQGTGKRGKPKNFQCDKHVRMKGHSSRMQRNVPRERIDAYPVHSLSKSTTIPSNHAIHRYGCSRSLLSSSDLGRRFKRT